MVDTHTHRKYYDLTILLFLMEGKEFWENKFLLHNTLCNVWIVYYIHSNFLTVLNSDAWFGFFWAPKFLKHLLDFFHGPIFRRVFLLGSHQDSNFPFSFFGFLPRPPLFIFLSFLSPSNTPFFLFFLQFLSNCDFPSSFLHISAD
jgi:hypothetical protein